MELEVTITGQDKAAKYVRDFQEVWPKLRKNSILHTTYEFKGRLFDWIKSFGEGSWEKYHPVTMEMTKKSGVWQERNRKIGERNFNWLSKYITSITDGKGYVAKVTAGKAKYTRDKAREERAGQVIFGHATEVTAKVKRLFGATRKEKTDRPGKDFFPLRRDTTKLVIGKHPILEPVFQKHQKDISKDFEKSFQTGYDKFSRGKP